MSEFNMLKAELCFIATTYEKAHEIYSLKSSADQGSDFAGLLSYGSK
ncbi:hypothetical protein KIH39_25245 [Telmatocola sphagniphila]|uniref:Uncharacterized protein n=1 Tax=Telmatocola sphagniphila TaxID=1123043 RepID=A0A8E6B661_9BACT|nr:hypothetical protein [Telmatocola sphagniphila]QVL32102.1 hypothetical protein KIH39_25245 [Telmatocola sphagniphila]